KGFATHSTSVGKSLENGPQVGATGRFSTLAAASSDYGYFARMLLSASAAALRAPSSLSSDNAARSSAASLADGPSLPRKPAACWRAQGSAAFSVARWTAITSLMSPARAVCSTHADTQRTPASLSSRSGFTSASGSFVKYTLISTQTYEASSRTTGSRTASSITGSAARDVGAIRMLCASVQFRS